MSRWECVVGLTGGMGSGKSTVLALFRRKGAFTLDADGIVHDLLERDRAVRAAIRAKFGVAVFSAGGRLDRRALAAEVFVSPARRRWLQNLLHPLVRKRIWRELGRKSGRVAVIDIPLLYESGWQKKLDTVVVVDARMRQRLARLEKKGFAAADAKRRIKAQMDLKEKVRRADYVVDNSGSIKSTQKQVDKIWAALPTQNHGGV